MKKLIFFLIILPLLSMKTGSKYPQNIRPGKDLAVFFAVEKYQNPKLGDLQNPVRNAYDIAAELKNRFGFDTEVLENPTLDQIEQKIESVTRDYENGKRSSDGQLLLFFSGHGMTEYENGFFLPADSDPARPQRTALAYEYWRPKINAINCRHILVAIDACYSVRFDPEWKNKPDGQFKRPGELTETQKALANYEAYKARVFFTSDNKEDQTPDRSNFAKKMLEGLRSGTARDGFLTSKQLFANHIEGATPTPRAGTFGDDEASSAYLFYEKIQIQASGSSASEQDKDLWRITQASNTPDAYRRYIRDCKLCLFTAEAETAILAVNKKYNEATPSKLKDSLSDKPKDSTTSEDPLGLVFIRGGTFKMGCTSEQQDCDEYEEVVHSVTLSDFYIGKFEVTQRIWREITGSDPEELRFAGCDECPVENVSWNDVQDFLKKLNAKYPGWSFRLPTEAEWEFAARGGGKQVMFGNGKNIINPAEINFDARPMYEYYTVDSKGQKVPVGSPVVKSYVIYEKIVRDNMKTKPVGSLNSPNILGLHDMSGNVSEWCSDWDSDYPSEDVINPMGPDSGFNRIIRGGCWSDVPWECRVSFRWSNIPDYSNDGVGFRLARSK